MPPTRAQLPSGGNHFLPQASRHRTARRHARQRQSRARNPSKPQVLSGVASSPGPTVSGIRTAPVVTAPADMSLDSECRAAGTGCVAADIIEPESAVPTGPSFVRGIAPTARVSILTPVSRTTFTAGALILFMARAENANEQTLSRLVVWQSSLDGSLGAGEAIIKSLTLGTHTITAAVTLDDGRTIGTSITLIVGAAR